MLDSLDPWPPELLARLLHPGGAVAAALAMAPPGARALDLGTGWPSLAAALVSCGLDVTIADPVLLRLRFERLMSAAPVTDAVHLALTSQLPWPDDSFDRVFVDTAEVQRAQGDLRFVIGEVARVLAPEGVAVVAQDAGGPSSRGRLLRLLREVGLPHATVLVARPGRADWSRVLDESRWGQHLTSEASQASAPSVRGKRLLKAAIAAAGGVRWLPADRFVVAHGPEAAPCDPLAEILAEPAGSRELIRLSDARVAVLGQESFVKLPLSRHQQDALIQEAQNTRRARSTGFAPHVIRSVHVHDWHGLPYVRYPLIRERHARPGEAEQTIAQILRGLAPGRDAPLGATAFWERLTGARGARDADEAGARALRARVLDTMAEVSVPAGPTHGDLHADNLLLVDGGAAILVDWNRFEPFNPLVLDAGYAAIEHDRRSHGGSLAQALVRFRDRELTGPLAELASSTMGDLDSAQAATLILLDRVVSYSQPRRRYKPWTMPAMARAVAALAD